MTRRIFPVVVLLALAPLASGADGQDDLARDRQRIQGTWTAQAYDLDGKALPAEIVQTMRVVIEPDRLVITPKVSAQRIAPLKEVKFTAEAGRSDQARYRLEATKKRKVIELTQDVGPGEARKIKGLYALDGDSLTICLPLADGKLPNKVPTMPKNGLVRMVLRRAPAGDK
jgi:uncharacterized protein (TIGR03067 family)